MKPWVPRGVVPTQAVGHSPANTVRAEGLLRALELPLRAPPNTEASGPPAVGDQRAGLGCVKLQL